MATWIQDLAALVACGCIVVLTIYLVPFLRAQRRSLDEGEQWKR